MEDTQMEVRDERGRMIAPLPGSEKTRFTADNARSMVQKRWEKYRQAAVKRITDEARAVDLTVSTGADAFGLVAAKQFTALMDSDKPRIADLEKLGNIMTGATAEPRRENERTSPNSGITASPAALLELVGMIESQRRLAVEQARATDAESTDTRNG